MTSSRSLLPSRHTTAGAALLLAGAFAATSCGASTSNAAVATTIALGTWGGENAGVIVTDSLVHVHIGCTKGDFRRPPALDANGAFSVAGSYQPRAYPIEIGPTVPARFTGTIRGDRLTITVVVDDTIMRRAVTYGPATADRGREPRLGPCPICERPEEMAGRQARTASLAVAPMRYGLPAASPVTVSSRLWLTRMP